MESNRTGGVSENASVEESISEFGFGIKPQTDEQIRTFIVNQAREEIARAEAEIVELEASIKQMFADRDEFGICGPSMADIRIASRNVDTLKDLIATFEVILKDAGEAVAA